MYKLEEMKPFKILLSSLIVVSCSTVYSQSVLTKEEALSLTLENNYDIRKTVNTKAISENNASLKNTGFLPSVVVSGGGSYKNQNSETEFQGGNINKVEGAESKAYSAAVGLNYTLFSGFSRVNVLRKLKETYQLTELQAQQVMEQTIIALFSAYYEVARLSEENKNREEALLISKRRLERARSQFKFGQTTKLQVLNAEVDVDSDELALRQSHQQLENAKRDLNLILGRAIEEEVQVDGQVDFIPNLNREELLEMLKNNNAVLLQTQRNIAISQFDIKMGRAGWMPNVGLTSSYAWNRNVSDPVNPFSPISATQTGINAGLNLSWNLFDGGKTSVVVQNAKIALDNQKIEQEKQEAQLQRNLSNVWELYQNQLFNYQSQEKLIETAQQNFDRTKTSYELGQVTSVEFRQAQLNLLNAKLRGNTSKFRAKNTELQLLQLAGNLLENKVY
ncbi:MAG: TolC family protein [Flavobacteriales bacterium]|nr:TolC family protein [Flavobacteriales bacterium]